VVGQDGRKISKSDGKPQTADTFIRKYGVDVIRLWVASTDFRNDIPLSEEILGHIAETYRLFRNTLRFQVSNLFDFDLGRDAVPDHELDPIDQWALAKTEELIRQVTEAFDRFEFHRVYQLCNQFCSVTLSSLYHDILKDRLYTLAPDSHLRRSSQTAIHRIFDALVRLLAPIIPFTCDEAWSYARHGEEYAEDNVLLHGWPKAAPATGHDGALEDVESLLQFRSQIYEKLEHLRKAGEIGKSLEASVTIQTTDSDPLTPILERHRDGLAEILIVSQLKLERKTEGEADATVQPARGGRCPRCWRTLEDLDDQTDSPHPCARCNDATEQS
jgi:isoleucyl-tRNA synthetase